MSQVIAIPREMTRLEAQIDPKSTAVDLVTFDLTLLDSGM